MSRHRITYFVLTAGILIGFADLFLTLVTANFAGVVGDFVVLAILYALRRKIAPSGS